MNYFELYKNRFKDLGNSTSENRVINMTNNIESLFKDDGSYREAIINFNSNNKIDCRFSESPSNLFEKYFLFKPSDFNNVEDGMYLEIDEGVFLLSELNLDKIYRKGKAFVCNSILKAKGLKDMPCYADNTTYGVKGLQDNDYFKESDKRLKIKVQANDTTVNYYEGQRFLFGSNSSFTDSNKTKNEFVCYKVTSKDFTVLKNQYVLELTKDQLQPSLDDLENGIAYNEKVIEAPKEENVDIINKGNIIEDNITEDSNVEPNIILSSDKCKVGENMIISITPMNAELITDEFGKLELIGRGRYKFTGIKSGDYATLQLVKGDKILKEDYILIY